MSLCDNCKHLMIYKNGDYVDDVSCFKNHTEVLSPSKMYCNDFAEDYTAIIKSNEFLLKENKRLMKENQELRMSPRVDVNEIESLVCENEKLKSELEESKKAHSNCDKLWWELHDEKEQLEKENEQLKNDCGILVQSNQDYRKENEQLKYRIKKLQNELNNCEEDYILEEYL